MTVFIPHREQLHPVVALETETCMLNEIMDRDYSWKVMMT